MVTVAVVGGGVIGLSTAQALLEDYPSIKLTVYSDAFTPHTTGDVSAGVISPYLYSGNNLVDIKEWTKETIEHLAEIRLKGDFMSTGISRTSVYYVSKSESPDLGLLPMFDGFREMKKDELRRLTNVRYAKGYFITTWSCDCRMYLPYIMNCLKEQGVQFVKETIISLDELATRGFDVVINCTGYGATRLTQDRSLQPIQGQVLAVKAPWIKHGFFEMDGNVYLFPLMDRIIIGGTRDIDITLKLKEALSKKIFSGACEVFPSLQHAEIFEQNVGLRPGRRKIRMDMEHKVTKCGRSYVVVHHYGHGGAGVSLHWGCAKKISSLLYSVLCSMKPNL